MQRRRQGRLQHMTKDRLKSTKVETVKEAKMKGVQEAVGRPLEAMDEDGLQSQSAAELVSDSPASTPSTPVPLIIGSCCGPWRFPPTAQRPPSQRYPLCQRLCKRIPLVSLVRSAIDESVDELGMQWQSAPGPGSDSPAPAPSAPLFTGARRFR